MNRCFWSRSEQPTKKVVPFRWGRTVSSRNRVHKGNVYQTKATFIDVLQYQTCTFECHHKKPQPLQKLSPLEQETVDASVNSKGGIKIQALQFRLLSNVRDSTCDYLSPLWGRMGKICSTSWRLLLQLLGKGR